MYVYIPSPIHTSQHTIIQKCMYTIAGLVQCQPSQKSKHSEGLSIYPYGETFSLVRYLSIANLPQSTFLHHPCRKCDPIPSNTIQYHPNTIYTYSSTLLFFYLFLYNLAHIFPPKIRYIYPYILHIPCKRSFTSRTHISTS